MLKDEWIYELIASPEFVHDHMKSIKSDWRCIPFKVLLYLIHKKEILQDKLVCNPRSKKFLGDYIISHIDVKSFLDLTFSSCEH